MLRPLLPAQQRLWAPSFPFGREAGGTLSQAFLRLVTKDTVPGRNVQP